MSQPSGYNFFGQAPAPQAFSPSPQQLAAIMAMPEYNNATSFDAHPYKTSSAPDMSGFAKMMQGDQYAPGYTDSAGVSGDTLKAYGIAPGASSNMFGLGGLSIFGGGGNPLNLSSGSRFTSQDLSALKGAFNG